MAKGRFINQKLGKRTSRTILLRKSQLKAQDKNPPRQQASAKLRLPKRGVSREPYL